MILTLALAVVILAVVSLGLFVDSVSVREELEAQREAKDFWKRMAEKKE